MKFVGLNGVINQSRKKRKAAYELASLNASLAEMNHGSAKPQRSRDMK